jgi:hypothetical protein
MTYPYPELLPLLQFRCTTDAYQRAITPYLRQGSNRRILISLIPAMAEYWQIIPTYPYAECPYCHTRYHSSVDTYALWGWYPWRVLRDALYVPEALVPPIRCPHFIGVQQFLNLHQQPPTELEYFDNASGDVPYLSRGLFAARVPTAAILHALPICRIEDDQFAPRYTIFALTYFSQNPQAVLGRVLAREAARASADPEYFGTELDLPDSSGADYDLPACVKRGQLGWLDVTQATLPLRIGKDLQLPAIYGQIPGNRWSYTYRPSGIRRS